jgi:hypothetical protein
MFDSLLVAYYDSVASALPKSGSLHLSILRLISFLPIRHEALWGARWAFLSTDVPDPRTEISYLGEALICRPERFTDLQKLAMALRSITGFSVLIIRGSNGTWRVSYSPLQKKWIHEPLGGGSCQRS